MSEDINEIMRKDMSKFPARTYQDGNTEVIRKQLFLVNANVDKNKKIPMVKDIANLYYNPETGITPLHPLNIMTAISDECGWVQHAINVISAAAASSIPLFRIQNNAKKSYKNSRQKDVDAIVDVLNRPNLQQTSYQFFKTIFENLVLYGNAYVQIIKNRKGDIHSLYTLPPETMRAIPFFDDDGILHFGYVQVNNSFRPMNIFLEDEIIHFKTTNPKSFVYGKPIFYALLVQVASNINAQRAVASWFENGFVGGAVFQMEADPEVAERNREFLRSEYTKPENFGSLLLLEGGVELIDNGNKFVQGLDFKSITDTDRDNLLMAAGVPLSQAGVRSSAGNSNIQIVISEEKAFLRNTVIPFQKLVFDSLTDKLFYKIMGWDDVRVEAGSPIRFSLAEEIATIEALGNYGITPNEVRDLLGTQRVPSDTAGGIFLINTNNGTIKATDVLGLDLATGEESESMFDLQQKAQELKNGASGTGGDVKKVVEEGKKPKGNIDNKAKSK